MKSNVIMKFLFICRANVGRSQMAEALFNSLTKDHVAISAGLNPPKNWEGEKLCKTKYVAPCLAEIGIDVTEKVSKRLTKSMVQDSDRIVVIGERNDWPSYLENSKLCYWDIIDPDIGEIDLHRIVRDQIKSKVIYLLNEIENISG